MKYLIQYSYSYTDETGDDVITEQKSLITKHTKNKKIEKKCVKDCGYSTVKIINIKEIK